MGILLLILAMFCITINDVIVKRLSTGYPLHEIIFFRSVIGLAISVVVLQFEGGFATLFPRRPGLLILRAVLLVFANMTFFAGLAALGLAEATAIFFVAPLFITLFSIPLLGAKVGPRRIAAVSVGFLGVIVMMARPGTSAEVPLVTYMLPVAAAFFYSLMQITTRKLGETSTASAMAVYVQAAFVVVCVGFFLVAGDGRFAVGTTNPSVEFLLRPWVIPAAADLWAFAVMGGLVGVVGWTIAQAYRVGEPATMAPFEYVALPLAVLWGWLFFGDLPDLRTWAGILLIGGAGVYVFLRERIRGQASR